MRADPSSAQATPRGPYRQPFAAVEQPNDEWAGDFKGWMRTGDGERIDPLTISDTLQPLSAALPGGGEDRHRAGAGDLRSGLSRIRDAAGDTLDNGAPFASCAVAGLSRLAVWWIKLGIGPQRIEAGHPEQNGRHERMHRTLKQASASPPKANRRMQQQAFDEFRREYNQVRPHQALAMETPESVYCSSPRPFPARVPEPEYDTAHEGAAGVQARRSSWNTGTMCFSARCSMASALACCPSTIVTYASTWPGIRSPGWIRRDYRSKNYRTVIGRQKLEAWKCGNPKKRDSHIPTTTTATIIQQTKNRTKSVKYMPGLKRKLCPRLDSESPLRGCIPGRC